MFSGEYLDAMPWDRFLLEVAAAMRLRYALGLDL